ncbi:MAG: hypothetical protein OXE77_05810 [Flavobacteriaceae bacterium]|nr:hypothetical protein [Flavobacteriaceae bacterium]MCY4268200.1 hypothetical protein [Flavobacteriaceae bacterium]MCY4300085.1 hypothetical protein [Flavobacteriaceae bacterium]
MKFDLKVIVLLFFIVMVVFSSIFSNNRNASRHVAGVLIDMDDPFGLLTNATIKKSINEIEQFQNKKVLLEDVKLSSIETHLNKINGVEQAEVFLYPDGILGVSVRSRKPLFQVLDGENYFVDQYGVDIDNILKFKTEIPKYLGSMRQENKLEITKLFQCLLQDDFLSKELDWISEESGQYKMKMKSYPFEIFLGSNKNLRNKLGKLKVFCVYYTSKPRMKDYQEINLEYNNQVLVKNQNG